MREYWSGIVFNGEKIGFSHLAVAPSADQPGHYELRSEAAFALRFAGYEKRVDLKAWDLVGEDLRLARFRYRYTLDGSELAIEGAWRDGAVEFAVNHAGGAARQRIPAPQGVLPQSAIGLYPSLHGLAPGREYRYPVFSGELQKVTEVTQRVAAWERSPLFEGAAFRIETAMEGYAVRTWTNARTEPVLEMAMEGVLISGLEDERRAKGHLATASLNKSEAFATFGLVRPENPLERPREITAMRVRIVPGDRAVPSSAVQRCIRDRRAVTCDIRPDGSRAEPAAVQPRDLAATTQVPATHPTIVALARGIAGDAADSRTQVRRVIAWMQENIRASPADVWSALDVLEKREAECQGHAYLYAALARALGIPTRVVNGLAYSEEHRGFLFHAWAESAIDGRWNAVDPTFGAIPADATHVKLVEGETLAELLPLADWIGKVELQVLAVEHGTSAEPPSTAAAFTVIPLGTAGGLDEGNLSSYLLAPAGANDLVALDAGTLMAGLRPARALGSLEGMGQPPDSPLTPEAFVLRERIKAYLVSHAHLDHVAGLAINSPDDAVKDLLGSAATIDAIRDHLFNWRIWPNFGNEGVMPQLKKYRYVRLAPGVPTPIAGTAMTVEALPLSHGGEASTAFLLRAGSRYAAYFGDTGPDAVEKSRALADAWTRLAPLVRSRSLSCLFLEVSYPDGRPDGQLYGHLTPAWLMREMHALARAVDIDRPERALAGLTLFVTHVKPALARGEDPVARIARELEARNDLGLRLVFPEQGRKAAC